MAYKIELDASKQIIRVIFSGATDLDSKLQATEEVVKWNAGREALKILVDVL